MPYPVFKITGYPSDVMDYLKEKSDSDSFNGFNKTQEDFNTTQEYKESINANYSEEYIYQLNTDLADSDEHHSALALKTGEAYTKTCAIAFCLNSADFHYRDQIKMPKIRSIAVRQTDKEKKHESSFSISHISGRSQEWSAAILDRSLKNPKKDILTLYIRPEQNINLNEGSEEAEKIEIKEISQNRLLKNTKKDTPTLYIRSENNINLHKFSKETDKIKIEEIPQKEIMKDFTEMLNSVSSHSELDMTDNIPPQILLPYIFNQEGRINTAYTDTLCSLPENSNKKDIRQKFIDSLNETDQKLRFELQQFHFSAKKIKKTDKQHQIFTYEDFIYHARQLIEILNSMEEHNNPEAYTYSEFAEILKKEIIEIGESTRTLEQSIRLSDPKFYQILYRLIDESPESEKENMISIIKRYLKDNRTIEPLDHTIAEVEKTIHEKELKLNRLGNKALILEKERKNSESILRSLNRYQHPKVKEEQINRSREKERKENICKTPNPVENNKIIDQSEKKIKEEEETIQEKSLRLNKLKDKETDLKKEIEKSKNILSSLTRNRDHAEENQASCSQYFPMYFKPSYDYINIQKDTYQLSHFMRSHFENTEERQKLLKTIHLIHQNKKKSSFHWLLQWLRSILNSFLPKKAKHDKKRNQDRAIQKLKSTLDSEGNSAFFGKHVRSMQKDLALSKSTAQQIKKPFPALLGSRY